jgi:predicted DCC family thiol-disulfide oxidoreductase YuxK
MFLVYDGQCPACTHYGQLLRIKQTAGALQLVDAREGGKLVEEITRRGYDLDRGMVLVSEGRMYYGADAMHVLALMSTRSGVFNRLNYWFFRSAALARVLYPVLRCGRGLLLKMLGRTKINNLHLADNERF